VPNSELLSYLKTQLKRGGSDKSYVSTAVSISRPNSKSITLGGQSLQAAEPH